MARCASASRMPTKSVDENFAGIIGCLETRQLCIIDHPTFVSRTKRTGLDQTTHNRGGHEGTATGKTLNHLDRFGRKLARHRFGKLLNRLVGERAELELDGETQIVVESSAHPLAGTSHREKEKVTSGALTDGL